jgi:hypothetical protein
MATEMNIQVCEARAARKAFWWRKYINFGWGLVIFVPVCYLLMMCCNPIVAALLAFVPAILRFLYLENRIIIIECPSCGKDINTNTPWECGFKKCRNENVHKFPFIHECEICHYPPKAYVCHHCSQLVYLTSDRQREYAAKRLEAPKPPPPPSAPPKDPAKEKLARQEQEIQDAKHRLAMTMYDKETEIVKNKPVVPPPVSPESQRIQERMRKLVEGGESVINSEKTLDEEIAKKYGRDSKEYAEMQRVILHASWLEKERLERAAERKAQQMD